MEGKKIFVVGAGLMGSGIAQVSAQVGYSVLMRDITEDALKKGMASIRWSLTKFAEKGTIKESPETVMGRITTTKDLQAGRDADLVIEAVFEQMEVKQGVFKELDGICKPEAIIASNTSALPISEIAAVTRRPEKVVGIHFFSPVPMMRIVEVVRGLLTAETTLETARQYVLSLGKEYITVHKDLAGFALNRCNIPATLEAIRLVEMGVASPEDIDKGMRLGFGRPMGPFETNDLTGLDVSLNAALNVYNETHDPKFWPPALMFRKVKAGHLGRKTGRGWYEYTPDGKRKS
jgi:3-hydroxybutyryl-CoA dehydrogenase